MHQFRVDDSRNKLLHSATLEESVEVKRSQFSIRDEVESSLLILRRFPTHELFSFYATIIVCYIVQMENHITILKRSLIELFLIKIALVLILHEYKRAEKGFFVSISFKHLPYQQ